MSAIGSLYEEPPQSGAVLPQGERRPVMADNKIQGEGNYDAARKFDKDEAEFVKKGDYEKKARQAEQALDGPEGEDLERARRETGEGKTH
jgi:hypothetical protein